MAATATAQAATCATSISKSSFVTGRRIQSVQTPSISGKKANFSVRAEKGNWFPGSTSPAYLDGSLPGDNGFDPFGLASDADSLKWLTQAELVHSRWAMLGAAGILLTDFGREAGILDIVPWYEAGVIEYAIPTPALTFIEIVLVGWAEANRWADIVNPGSVNNDPIFKGNKVTGTTGYPGFDPLGLGKGDAKAVLTLKEKELANGRLAMLANLGFWVQYAYTGTTPTANLLSHIADPGHNNFYGSFFN